MRRPTLLAGLVILMASLAATVVPTGSGSPGAERADAAVPRTCQNGPVALTFDDGPDPATTGTILDILKANNAKATFFVIGEHVTQFPSFVQRARAEGHRIANHTWDHTDLTTLSSTRIRSQFQRTNNAVTATGAPKPVLYRPPFGETNNNIRSIGASEGMTEVLWNIDSEDWNGRPPSEIRSRVRAGLRPNRANVVLMHDGWSPDTPAALQGILDDLHTDGYCLAFIEPDSSANVPDVGKIKLVLNEGPTNPPTTTTSSTTTTTAPSTTTTTAATTTTTAPTTTTTAPTTTTTQPTTTTTQATTTTTQPTTTTTAPGGVVPRTCTSGPVALTFSSGPDPTNTPLVLDALKTRDAKATFFVIGQQVTWWPAVMQRVHNEGHRIGNQSFTAPDLTTLTQAQIQSELQQTNDAVIGAGGPKPTLFRPPYGATNATVRQVAQSMGMTEVRWNIDSEDWAGRPAAQIRSRVRAGLRPNTVLVVLLHDGWTPETPKAIQGIIDDLHADGYCLAWIVPNSATDVPGVGRVRLELNEQPTTGSSTLAATTGTQQRTQPGRGVGRGR